MDLTGQIKFLVAMLERLSADSPWAHQASGLRGTLLKQLEKVENSPYSQDNEEQAGLSDSQLMDLIEAGYRILARAAEESFVKRA